MANRSYWKRAARVDAQPVARAVARPMAPVPAPSDESGDAELLFATLLAAQNGELPPHQRPRRGVRIRRALPVEICWASETLRGCTLDFGTGGFAALLACAPPRDARLVATLRLARKALLVVDVRVVASRERRGSARVSFAFERLDADDRARLQAALVDDAVSELKLTPAPRRG